MLIHSWPARTKVIYRNGIAFQIPLSNHSSWRFTVHPDGSGTGWDENAPDVDQPHGLDYRSLQDLRKGVRKRMAKEHTTPADATVGGEHIPGGCAVVDVVDTTADVTDGWNDGTYTGGGLVWCSAELLWLCGTCDGTYNAVADATILKLHPDKQWGGRDVTWTGGHEFDASVDISGNTTIFGTLQVDGTGALFGGTAGIGLFYDPTVYAGGQTTRLGNGLILKFGHKTTPSGDVASGTVDVSYTTAFPTATVSAVATLRNDTLINVIYSIDAVAKTGFTFYYTEAGPGAQACDGFDWIAMGY